MPHAFPYRMQVNEPSIHVEIYLPKKARLQGILYETLTAGFRREEVAKFFTDLNRPRNKARRARVRELVSPDWVLQADLTAAEAAAFPRLFFGYSMYEVDGVYLKQTGQAPGDPDDNYTFEEERTQVIRMVFKYNCASASPAVIDYIKAALRDPLSDLGPLAANYGDADWVKQMPPAAAAALGPLYDWLRYVGWFLYGFVLFQICEKIVELYRADAEAEEPSVRQEEIWVTSLWNLNVNVIKWTDRIALGDPGS